MKGKNKKGFWTSGAFKVLILALIMHLVVRIFIFEIFRVPTGSMMPNILVGDHIFVTKYSYGYGPYSGVFPMPFKGRIFFTKPKRGDIIVFYGNGKTYVKRLVGLPGDKVQLVRGKVKVNGKLLPRESMKDVYVDMNAAIKSIFTWNKFQEKSADDVSYTTISGEHSNLSRFPNTTREYIVPYKHYFFLGDNRDYSRDSRFILNMGFVHEDNLKGKVRFVLYNSKYLMNMNSATRFLHKLK